MTDGERWARELLVELRAERFTPSAWRRFFARSLARAAARRAERRRAHVQTLLLGVAGLAVWGGAAAAGGLELAAAGAAWWLLVVLMLDWHLGMIERPDGQPLEGLGVANALSVLRAGLVPALPVLSPRGLAVALVVAWASDVLDGQLARARREQTRLGLWLDGTVDTFVLGVAALAEARGGLLSAWIAGLAVTRYALPWLVAPVYLARAEVPRREALVPGRVPGFVLLAGLLLAAVGSPVGAALVAAGALAGLATFAASVGRSLARRRPAATEAGR